MGLVALQCEDKLSRMVTRVSIQGYSQTVGTVNATPFDTAFVPPDSQRHQTQGCPSQHRLTYRDDSQLLLRFHRFHMPVAAERPASFCFPAYSVAAVRPSILTLSPFSFSLVTLMDAFRSLDVSRIARNR